MRFPRSSGVLLHVTSLPGQYGVGDMGAEAYRFADFLAGCGQSIWQVLSLGPTGYGNSPYQCFSVFAGNPLLVSCEKLVEEGFALASDLMETPAFSEGTADYQGAAKYKKSVFRRSFDRFSRGSTHGSEFAFFCVENSDWLDDYAMFMALKYAHGDRSWRTWEEDVRLRHTEALLHWRRELAGEIDFQKYQQFLFFRQWLELREYCNGRGIRIVGDLPIFVALDSADVWAHQDLFFLDRDGMPTVVAGVPPDYFSKDGQLWGNPLYRWGVMDSDGYRWWMDRVRATHRVMDIIRLDHFRGFEKYWEIPAPATTARGGKWVPGPGAALFEALRRALGDLPLIAEDLGYITREVHALRDQFGLPGMKVLQFSFGGDPAYKEGWPYTYPQNCVVYTGTHDNDTVVGWFRGRKAGASTLTEEEKEKERSFVLKYLGTDGHEINWDMIRLAFSSVADTAIVPVQDLLGLGSEARMNLPGSTERNWIWRLMPGMLTDDIKAKLRELTLVYGRLPEKAGPG